MSQPAPSDSAHAAALAAYPRRLGALLRGHRRARGLRRRALAASSGGHFRPGDLRDLEHGRRELSPDLLDAASAVYGIDVAAIEAARTSVVVDLDAGVLRVGDVTAPLPHDTEGTLARYVELVNRLRSTPMRSPATLRSGDTRALAEALDLDEEEVVGLLTEAIGEEATARRKVAALRSGTGTLAAVVVLGGVAVALRDDAPRTSEARLAAESTEEVAETAAPDDGDVAVDDGGATAGDAAGAAGGTDALAAAEVTPSAPAQPRTPPAPATSGDAAAPDGDAGTDAPDPGTGDPGTGDPGTGDPGDVDDAEATFEDETDIDAPDGPVDIERDDADDEGDD